MGMQWFRPSWSPTFVVTLSTNGRRPPRAMRSNGRSPSRNWISVRAAHYDEIVLSVELQQIDPSRNRFRVYRMSEQPTLFGGPDLVIEWGRLGRPLRLRAENFDDVAALARRRAELLARRRRHRYLPMLGSEARAKTLLLAPNFALISP